MSLYSKDSTPFLYIENLSFLFFVLTEYKAKSRTTEWDKCHTLEES